MEAEIENTIRSLDINVDVWRIAYPLQPSHRVFTCWVGMIEIGISGHVKVGGLSDSSFGFL